MAEKILIIDDDLETLRLVKLMLERLEYKVFTAPDGLTGLEMVKNETPDLVLLDVMMPKMDGYEVARQIRATSTNLPIPILMFTAKSQIEDKVNAFEAGVDGYLTKPTHPKELAAQVRALLRRSKTSGGLESAPLKEERLLHGEIIGVVAARGGLGCSTLALNLALLLQKKSEAGICAVEMHPGMGRWSQELNLEKVDGLCSLLQMTPEGITAEAVKREITYHRSGVRLLLASHHIQDAALMQALPQMEKIIQQLMVTQAMSLLDIGAVFSPGIEKVLAKCSQVLLVIDPNPATISSAKRLVQDLGPLDFGNVKPLVPILINHQRMDMQLSRTQIQDELGLTIEMVISPAPELAYQAMLRHTPLALIQPDGLLAQQIGQVANYLFKFLPAPVA